MALIRDIDRNQRQQTIALGMISVCRDLGIDVVTEGVERPGEMNILRNASVRYVQGYLFARPQVDSLVPDEDIPFDYDQ